MNNKSNAGSIFYLEKRKRWVWVGTYNNEQGEKKKTQGTAAQPFGYL